MNMSDETAITEDNNNTDAEVTNDESTLLDEPTTTENNQVQETESTDAEPKETESKVEKEEHAELPDYTDFVLPETMPYSDDIMAEYKEVAKSAGLPQDQAQKFVDLAIKNATTEQTKINAQRQQWKDEITADKEFGGLNLDKTVQGAKDTISRYGTPKVMELFEQTGLGNNPDLLKMLAKVSQKLSEDSSVDGKPTGRSKSHAQIIYPNMNQ